MNRELSLYLDVCRFSAAAMVFVSHVSDHTFTGGFLWQIGGYGQDAVAVFFVLSGFVIGFVSDTREKTAPAYAISRLARLYSVAVPALIITFLLDAIGRELRPEMYQFDYAGYVANSRFWQFISGLFFLNEIWNTHTRIGSNAPYWSLGYEAWYYIIFGLATFAPPRWRYWSAGLALVVIGPKVAALFPLWLIGLLCFRVAIKWRVPPWVGWLAFLGTPCLFLAMHRGIRGYCQNIYAPFDLTWPSALTWLYFMLVGILFAIHLVGFQAVRRNFSSFFDRHAARIRMVAGCTFSLYLFHMPLMMFLVAASPWPVEAWPTRAAVVLLTPALVFGLAELTERRKDVWRRAFVALFRLPLFSPKANFSVADRERS